MIDVIGLGLGHAPLDPACEKLIHAAELVGGGRRQLDILAIEPHRRLTLTSVEAFAAALRDRADRAVCVVADGDPLLFGIGATLLRFFDRRELRFHPHVSAVQTAAARFGLPWQGCAMISLHGRNNLAALFAALTHGRLVAVYTDAAHGPDTLARALLARGVEGWCLHVAEALETPEERLFSGTLEEACNRTWNPLNLVLLERIADPPLALTLGLREADLAHRQDLVTKQPTRALILSCLRLAPDAMFWDLGAGSGAISLEAASLLRHGRITAVERRPERLADIHENIRRTGAWLVEPVGASIEEFLEHQKADKRAEGPTHVFLGGGVSARTLHLCRDLLRPGGRLVVSAVLLSTLETTRHALADWPLTIHHLQHSQSRPLAGDLRLAPSNPIFVVESRKAVKPGYTPALSELQ